MTSNNHQRTAYPNRKISETFLDFAAPILRMMPDNSCEKDIQTALKIAFTVWNAIVLADVNGNHHYLNQILTLTSEDPSSGLLVNQLIARKRALFGDDQRLIGEYKVTLKHGKMNLWAEAREPRSLHRQSAQSGNGLHLTVPPHTTHQSG